MGGFLGTVAGKVAIVAAVVVVGGAATVVATQSLGNDTSAVESLGTGTSNTQLSENYASNAESNERDQDFFGRTEEMPTLENEISSTKNNVDKQEYLDPYTVLFSNPEVQIKSEPVVIFYDDSESYDNDYLEPYKAQYYDKDGNLIAYEISYDDMIESWGRHHAVSHAFYYADGTPWEIREYSNFSHEDFPQYGWYGVETFTENIHRYLPNGTLYGITSTETLYKDASGYTLKFTPCEKDGSVIFYDEFEYAEVNKVNKIYNSWQCIKRTRYNSDGTVIGYITYEYGENGERVQTNSYNADGELQSHDNKIADMFVSDALIRKLQDVEPLEEISQ